MEKEKKKKRWGQLRRTKCKITRGGEQSYRAVIRERPAELVLGLAEAWNEIAVLNMMIAL